MNNEAPEKIAQEWVDEYVALRDSLGSPVKWRSREKGSVIWRAHDIDPTDAISKYAVGGLARYEIDPLYSISQGACACLRPSGDPLGNCEACGGTGDGPAARTPEGDMQEMPCPTCKGMTTPHLRLTPMREHSETAWSIASRYSTVLASETRDLAAQIDAAMQSYAKALAQAKAGLEVALEVLPKNTAQSTMVRGALAFVREALGASALSQAERDSNPSVKP